MKERLPRDISESLESAKPFLSSDIYNGLERAFYDAIEISREYHDEVKQLCKREERLKTDRARYREGRNRARKERDLFKALLAADEQPAIRPYLDGVLKALIAKTGAQKAIIVIFSNPDEYRGEYSELVRHNYTDEEFEDFQEDQLGLSEGIVRRAIAQRAPIYTGEAERDQRFSEHASIRMLRLKTVLCVPLMGPDDKVAGVLYLEHRGRTHAFPEHERELVSMAAGFIARWVTRKILVDNAADVFDHTVPYRKRYGFREIVGKGEAIAEVLRLITVSLEVNTAVPVLLTGEAGTGKNLVAKALHFNGAWSRGAWVEVDCASLAEEQMDRVLAGALKEFGRRNERRTTRELKPVVTGGTLLIDNVSELSLPAQNKLLELLQETAVTRMGDLGARPLPARMIATSRRDLHKLVQEGGFLEELLFRLNVFSIHLPPLRERPEDIPVLADDFANRYSETHPRPVIITSQAFSYLARCPFPGNVRELYEKLQQAAMHAPDGNITAGLLAATESNVHAALEPNKNIPTWKEAIASFQRQLLVNALQRTNRNLQKTALLLGISRQHLSRLLHDLNLNEFRPAHRGRKPQASNAK